MDTKRVENLWVKQGATFRWAWSLTGVEQEGTTFLSQVRSADGTLLATLDVSWFELDGLPHALMEIPPEQSLAWDWTEGEFDVIVSVPGGVKTEIVGGRFTVRPVVSRVP